MIETLALAERGEFNATHILLMDDDVKILPESLKRTYALLRFVKDEYKDRFISGAMLFMDKRNEQHEDLGYMSEAINACISSKPVFQLHLYDHILCNEENYTQNKEYGGWWYCCIPMKFINKNSLSLPLFYRADDIEFSLRNDAKFITINGICIWHDSFWVKFNDCIEYYLFLRNYLFTHAISGKFGNIEVRKRTDKLFFSALRCFHYIGAEFILDAYEDYLKGPSFFSESNAEQVFKEHLAKNEKMSPVENFNVSTKETEKFYEYVSLNEQEMLLYIESNNGHELPDHLLKDDDRQIPEIHYILFESPGKQFMRKKLLFVNHNTDTAVLRTMDKEKYAGLMVRYRTLMQRYETENDILVKIYQSVAPKLYSEKFWRNYLGI